MRTRDQTKEDAIREKALEMIVREGFDGFSMQKLAKAAQVSPATIYIYYHNREDLISRLYKHVSYHFVNTALDGFDVSLTLREGLWVQWKNRLKFIREYPGYFYFFEQFRNSPLINKNGEEEIVFRDNMCRFVKNAVKRGELEAMDPEMFWAIAYGSFYTLVKFELQQQSIENSRFKITESKLRRLLAMVLRALKTTHTNTLI